MEPPPESGERAAPYGRRKDGSPKRKPGRKKAGTVSRTAAARKRRAASPRKNKGGQPILLDRDPKITDRVDAALRAGCSIKDACAVAGLSEATHFEYMAWAKDDGAPQRVKEYAERVARAWPVGKAYLAGLVVQQAKKDWRAAIALLERRDADWRKRDGVELTGADAGPVRVTVYLPEEDGEG
jgi:hypothetical protein